MLYYYYYYYYCGCCCHHHHHHYYFSCCLTGLYFQFPELLQVSRVPEREQLLWTATAVSFNYRLNALTFLSPNNSDIAPKS